VRRFSVERVGRSSAIFDEKKLRWLNGRYMRELPLDEYTDAVAVRLAAEGHEGPVADRERLRAACSIVQDKAQTLAEVWPLIAFVFEPPVEDERAWAKVMRPEVEPALAEALEALRAADPFDAQTLEAGLEPVVERLGVKARDLYQPLRVAITGTTVSPGIFDSLAVLGREEAVTRVEAALARLREG
jgi:glutamyl-tRNA synthetase